MIAEPYHARSAAFASVFGSAPRAIKLSAFTVIVATAALFGIAAETALAHFGLDLASDWTAWRRASMPIEQIALSWWCLWVGGWAAFFIGRRGAEWATTRLKFRLKVATGVLALLLAFAAAQLKPASSESGIGTAALFRAATPLAAVALALWGFGGARRRRGQSSWAALHEPFETPIAIVVRPAISAQAGTGVARRRFRIPPSRSTVIEMTRLMNDAAITAIAEIPGT